MSDRRDHTGATGTERKPSARRPGPARWFVWIVFGVLIALVLRNVFGVGAPDRTAISYSEFRAHVEAGRVERIVVEGDRIRGVLGDSASTVTAGGDTVGFRRFSTVLPSFGDDELLATLRQQDVDVVAEPQSTVSWWLIIGTILPVLILIWFGLMFMQRMRTEGRSILTIGQSQAKAYEGRREGTTFDDVAGAEAAKQELKEIVAYLKEPERFQAVGGKVPKGVLLLGPPGTGKTLLARAVAGEADVPFFSITGSDFMEMFVGIGASRVRDLFAKAKAAAPSIVFIDELDSIGRQRGAGLGGGHDEREQTLNQLLAELDGFEPTESVIVMAATNRPDILDPALLRPGRFDRRVTVPLPTARERLEILRIHARGKPLARELELEGVARSTSGLSGADLENLLNEAALGAARDGRTVIERDDLERARDRVLLGLERRGIKLSEQELRLLAYHEAGHAVIAASLPNTDPVHKVTIVPRGHAMGATQQLPERDRYLYRREDLLDRITVMMGGRAAERLVFETATSGAESDLREATRLARKMVLDWGMSERLGPVVTGRRDQVFLGEELTHRRDRSDETAREVDEEVRRMLDECHERALELLRERRLQLDRVVDRLLEDEELSGEEMSRLVAASPAEVEG